MKTPEYIILYVSAIQSNGDGLRWGTNGVEGLVGGGGGTKMPDLFSD